MATHRIDISSEHLTLLRQILSDHIPAVNVLLFGSRVQSTSHRFSDIDLALNSEEPLEPTILESLKDAFSLSALPYMVDVIELCRVTPDFREVILHKGVPLETLVTAE
jgi:predicted nucleotidyltransferase